MKQLIFVFCAFVFFSCSTPRKSSEKYDALVKINTRFGLMEAVLFEDTPKHKDNFIKLAEEGFYDSTTFHRVIKGFMIQGGDPNSKDDNPGNDGRGGPGYTLDAEIKHDHKKGYLAAARQGDQVNPKRKSSGSQFYIVHSEKGTSHLNGQYTVFGKLISGFSVLDSIANVNTKRGSFPEEPVYMTIDVEWVKKTKLRKNYTSYE